MTLQKISMIIRLAMVFALGSAKYILCCEYRYKESVWFKEPRSERINELVWAKSMYTLAFRLICSATVVTLICLICTMKNNEPSFQDYTDRVQELQWLRHLTITTSIWKNHVNHPAVTSPLTLMDLHKPIYGLKCSYFYTHQFSNHYVPRMRIYCRIGGLWVCAKQNKINKFSHF